MPTCNRRAFVPRAIEYFLRQDYPNKELVILDDGSDPVEDLVPASPALRYQRLGQKTPLGAKRNLACEAARGNLLMHWDDDDWHAPGRITCQVTALLERQAEICGLREMLFYDPQSAQTWLYSYPAGQRPWLAGGSLLYTREFWRQSPFTPVDVGEDTRFVWSRPLTRWVCLPDYRFYVALIHPANTSPKRTHHAYWSPWPGSLREVMGDDLERYRQAAAPVRPAPAAPAASLPERHLDATQPASLPVQPPRSFIPMFATALQSDLSLPEFAAFNQQLQLPKMRRWELPFALIHARLDNTMAVLDVTINPTCFQERIASLYPDVHYRHWNPLPERRFQLPFGVPDAAFERVFCINTLEHLTAEQREALVGEMAAKLKPGGRLILTGDFYFDSLYTDPACQRYGILPPDRQEICGGYNQVGLPEWQRLCQANGLEPLEPLPAAWLPPDPADSQLYRQDPPLSHASLGGVFVKPGSPGLVQPQAARKVTLGLLTWNTCQVSLESLQAHLREAHMLRRLGLEPFLCVVDNGSSDGTQASLQELEAGLDVPHRFILNPKNVGSSIARNQIIDASLEFGSDYILFMDGDIEIVPFSSFAMLRHLENSGRRLGCIGADSATYTPNRAQAAPALYSLDPLRKEIGNHVAWTQYGMFRREVFAAGIRFDENEPFNQAGWGFEDNDLAFQMTLKNFACQRFFGVPYLHRAMRSSVQNMRREGIDANHLFNWRKQYLLEKWATVPVISGNTLEHIRMINIRL